MAKSIRKSISKRKTIKYGGSKKRNRSSSKSKSAKKNSAKTKSARPSSKSTISGLSTFSASDNSQPFELVPGLEDPEKVKKRQNDETELQEKIKKKYLFKAFLDSQVVKQIHDEIKAKVQNNIPLTKKDYDDILLAKDIQFNYERY